MEVPKTLSNKRKMESAYYSQKIAAIIFLFLSFGWFVSMVRFSKGHTAEIIICVGISAIFNFWAAYTKNSFYLFQKLQEVHEKSNRSKE